MGKVKTLVAEEVSKIRSVEEKKMRHAGDVRATAVTRNRLKKITKIVHEDGLCAKRHRDLQT